MRGQHHPGTPQKHPPQNPKPSNSTPHAKTRRREENTAYRKLTTNPPLAPAGGEGSGVRGQHHPSPPPETPTKKTQNSAAQSLTRRREDAKTQNKHHLPKTKNQSPPSPPQGGEGSGVRGQPHPNTPPETPTPKPKTQQLNASREDAKKTPPTEN